MRRVALWSVGVALLPVILLYAITLDVFLFDGIPSIPRHQYYLSRNAASFRAVQHVPGSRLLRRVRAIPSIAVNECDYLTGEFRSSVLSSEGIARFYVGTKIRSWRGDDIPIHIYFEDEDPYQLGLWTRAHMTRPLGGTVYFVFALDDSSASGWDYRCH